MLRPPPTSTLFPYTTLFRSYSDVKSGLSTGATRLFVYGVFDKPVVDGASSGVKGYLRFDDRTVTLRIATSLISLEDRKSTRLNSSHPSISYAVFCLKKKKKP